uniref:Disease resistance protein RGA4 n=1 Tax=Cajanus cajan TaxID=3821 RepID=A0A151TTZ8_CAJCA|nr:Putative disease resistance protein RGA4 [Cajanus cajan]
MAESFLFSIAESLLAKLASRAYEEASQVLGVYDQLREFKGTLSLVKAVLLDADQKQEQEQNNELREWLSQIKRVFYDAEDVLDEFECQTLRKQVVKAHGTTKAKVGHFFSSSNPLVFRYRMARQIKDICKRLDKVAADRHKFGLQIIHVDRQLLMQQNPKDDDTGATGSKILVTTRSQTIASMMGTIPSHNLEGLPLEDSLSLFVKWAFKEGEEEKHPHLVNIGREIVTRCGGVPLAVRTLGSLLFSKYEANEWEYVRDNGIWNMPQEKDDILPALKLSYDLMPSYLRQCFALFSLYPKDHEFDTNSEALLNICVSKFKYLRVLDLSYSACETLPRSIGKLKHLRYFSIRYNPCIKGLPDSICKLQNLQVLNLVGCMELEALPKGLKKLISLRDFRITTKQSLVALPQWLQGTANSLQSLVISSCYNLKMLPEWLSSLTNLKTLAILGCPEFLSLPDNICHLTALESLMIEGCPELSRKCQPRVGEFWPKISHIKHVHIEEPIELEEKKEESE